MAVCRLILLMFSVAITQVASITSALATPVLGASGTLATLAQQQGAGVFESTSLAGIQSPGYVANSTSVSFTDPILSEVSAVSTGAKIAGPPSSALISATPVSFGEASANLATGQLRFLSESQQISLFDGSAVRSSVAGIGASVAESDIITITGIIRNPVTIRLSMHVTGDIQAMASQFNAPQLPTDAEKAFVSLNLTAQSVFRTVDSQLGVGQLDGFYTRYSGATDPYGGITFGNEAFTTYDGRNPSRFLDFTLYDDVTVSDQYRNISFIARGFANPHPDGDGAITADFRNTANLSISLPDGLSFTSASGVFLTQAQTEPPTSVPEPNSIALLAACLVLFGVFRSIRQDGCPGAN